MSRTLRVLVALLVVSFAVGAAACADATAPHPACDVSNSATCH